MAVNADLASIAGSLVAVQQHFTDMANHANNLAAAPPPQIVPAWAQAMQQQMVNIQANMANIQANMATRGQLLQMECKRLDEADWQMARNYNSQMRGRGAVLMPLSLPRVVPVIPPPVDGVVPAVPNIPPPPGPSPLFPTTADAVDRLTNDNLVVLLRAYGLSPAPNVTARRSTFRLFIGIASS